MSRGLKKLCYILPVFDLKTDTHYFYLYDFINQIAERFELTLIIEKSNSDLSFFSKVESIKVQRFHSGIRRVLENFFLILSVRLSGTKTFYIHYSQISAINASIIARLSSGRTFYWSCGMMWLFGQQKLLNFVLKMVNYLVTGVKTLADGYAKHYNISTEKIKIMPNWIDLKRFANFDAKVLEKYKLSQDTKYILFVHRLAKRKGAHYIAALAKEFQDRSKVKFLIAGDGPYRAQLEEEIMSLNNVILLGKVPNQDIPSLMKAAYLFFMPSEEEGFPRVLLEAMAAGLPYSAFDIGGVREISPAEQQDYIVSDAGRLSRIIGQLLDDEVLCGRLSNINREHVQQFDMVVVKNKFIDLLK